jgi:DNA helicase IV
LAQLATRVETASNQAPTQRLARIYDRIHIDEVQDLSEYDLEVLAMLLDSSIPIDMVGDVRQAVIATNERGRKNKSFMYMGIWDWFRKAEQDGQLAIIQQTETRRCRPEIAEFADLLFDASCGFDPTVSLNTTVTGHDGLFLVRREDVPSYLADFDPLFLRYSKNSARNEPYAFMNYRASKGLTCDRVLVWPTAAVEKLITRGTPLEGRTACDLYVAVTRARQSAAFVMDQAGSSEIPFWG